MSIPLNDLFTASANTIAIWALYVAYKRTHTHDDDWPQGKPKGKL